MLAESFAAAALVCLDPGHGTPLAIGRQREPIGPGSRTTKIKDGGGAAGETEVVLAIARRTRTLLLRKGYRVAMTRTGPTYRGGNIERAQFCNRRRAALMLRILADTGFMSNPAEGRLLRSSSYQWRVARGLAAGVAAFRRPTGRASARRSSGLPHGRRGAGPRGLLGRPPPCRRSSRRP